jgi:hypothetical protein
MAPTEPAPSLKDLAEPKLFALPPRQIAAQDEIVTKLDKIIEDNNWGYHQIFGLGTIELPRHDSKTTPVLKDADAVLSARLQPLSANTQEVKLVLEKPTKRAIVKNVMDTLVMAGKLPISKAVDCLTKSGRS